MGNFDIVVRKTIIEFIESVDKNGPLPHKQAKVRTRCYQWTGSIDKDGYGLFKPTNGKTVRAHRFVWALKHGPRSIKNPKLQVCHKCDNPGCVRYSHLFRGTSIDNRRDCCRKGRQAKGDRNGARLYPDRLARGNRNGRRLHPESYVHLKGDGHWTRIHPEWIASQKGSQNAMAILTEKKVHKIRKLLDRGMTQRRISCKFGVTVATINCIATGKTWKHVK